MKCFQDVQVLSYALLQTENYYKIAFLYLLKSLFIHKCLFLYTSYHKKLMIAENKLIKFPL